MQIITSAAIRSNSGMSPEAPGAVAGRGDAGLRAAAGFAAGLAPADGFDLRTLATTGGSIPMPPP